MLHALSPLPPGTVATCTRCGSVITRRAHHDLHRTAAFSLAALLLYFPANVFPILRMERYGVFSENTVWQATVALFRDGEYVVSIIVFLASILIPLLKLIGLFYLSAAVKLDLHRGRTLRTRLYKAIEYLGRWAMLDVFILAILVSLVKLQRLATVVPGPGAFAFAMVVVFTLLASASFDPQLIWEKEEHVP
jgi:paraquat-inducible protein A